MKKHLRFFFLLSCILSGVANVCRAQTQFWADDLEGPSPSSGTRTPSVENFSGGPPNTRYFKRTAPASIAVSAPGYSNYQGSQIWACEDIDAAPNGVAGTQASEQNVTWSGINISGKTGLSFKGLFATGVSTVWDNNTTPNDYMMVEYRIDAGAWTSLVRFYPNGAVTTSGALALEITGDNIGDGATLNGSFAEFSANIPGTGTTLQIRCTMSANGLNEEAAFDNFRLFETTCTAPSITGQPVNRTICASSNTTFAATATGATAYQWQVDQTASGSYTNLSNVAPYSNVTTNTLTITGATGSMNGYRYRVVASNGVATCYTNSNYGTLTVSSISTSSGSLTTVACNGGSNGAASVSPSGGISPYTYSWSPSGGTNSSANGLSAGSYTVTVTDNIGCTAQRTYNVTQPSALLGSTSITNVTCYGASNGSIDLTPTGGTPGYTYIWGGGITTQDRINVPAGSYNVNITDANGCTKVVNATVTQPSSNPGSNNYLLPTSNQTVVSNANNSYYVSGNCELVNTVMSSGASPVTGSVTNKVWIEGSIPTQNGTPFVQRHYEITPSSNASTATGTVTLYFTQAEFDNFNAHAESVLDLPASPTDNTGKANLRIGKYSGTSGNGTGLPSTYTNGAIVINPDDNNIVWNAVSGAWEVTFAVEGFSGFVAQSSMFTLPVNWVSFSVRKQGQSAIVYWSTATEQNTKDFTVQHSVDGTSWNSITVLAAAGSSSSVHNYSYIHTTTGKGYNYYRIMQSDLDGKSNYSEVRAINMSADNVSFDVRGNVIKNGELQLQVYQTTSFSFYDTNGKLLWIKQFTPGLQSMNVAGYAKGVYLLKADGKTQKILVQ